MTTREAISSLIAATKETNKLRDRVMEIFGYSSCDWFDEIIGQYESIILKTLNLDWETFEDIDDWLRYEEEDRVPYISDFDDFVEEEEDRIATEEDLIDFICIRNGVGMNGKTS